MVVKQTDRIQIQNFANSGVEIFKRVEIKLQELVEKAATVDYQGPNAHAFKTACVRHAVEFAEQTSGTMRQMSEAIEQNTSFIATALGGQHISLDPPRVSITPPTIKSAGGVEKADDTALRGLSGDIDSIFNTIRSQFEENEHNFAALGLNGGWLGPEYENTRAALTRLTQAALEGCDRSRKAMNADIEEQISILFGA